MSSTYARIKIPDSVRRQVLERDNYTCQLCGANRDRDGALLHIDHINAVNKGGGNELSNLQILCQDCNVGKSDLV